MIWEAVLIGQHQKYDKVISTIRVVMRSCRDLDFRGLCILMVTEANQSTEAYFLSSSFLFILLNLKTFIDLSFLASRFYIHAFQISFQYANICKKFNWQDYLKVDCGLRWPSSSEGYKDEYYQERITCLSQVRAHFFSVVKLICLGPVKTVSQASKLLCKKTTAYI